MLLLSAPPACRWLPAGDMVARVMAKLLLHISKTERRVMEAAAIYYAEAVGDDTLVRQRAARRTRDVRELGQIERAWRRHGFVRIHDNYLVHPDRISRGPIVNSVEQRGSATDLATAHGQEAKRRGPTASLATQDQAGEPV